MLLSLQLALMPTMLGPLTIQTPPDYEAAAEYSRRQGGRALLVIVGDEVVLSRWQNHTRDTFQQTVFSGTKAFGCALAGLAMADGKLSLDELAADTFEALATRETSAAITVRDLLTQTSGLKGGGTPTSGDHHQWIRERARLLAGHRPGTRFTYGAAHSDLFAAIIREKVGEDPIAYLERRLLTPIGVTYSYWKPDGIGQRFLAFGLVTSPQSWARYGMLLRDGGVYEGRRYLPAEAVAECWRGSNANPAYGLGLWLNRPMPPEIKRSNGFPTTLGRLIADGRREAILPGGPNDLAMAAGSADTRLYIIPSRRMVIVRFGSSDRASFVDAELLRPILMPTPRER
jgi:CubicO group peptidase (beta-lactamase class C family)